MHRIEYSSSEGPLYFFRDPWVGILALRETWMRIYFFRDSWMYIFPSSGNWFSIFSWSVKHAFTFACVIFEPNTFTGIIFHFFEDFRVLKRLVNHTKLHVNKIDVKPAHSMSLRMDYWELTTATATWRAYNLQPWTRVFGQIWTLAFLRTRQMRIQPLLPNLAPTV